jgi:hypothetical protein
VELKPFSKKNNRLKNKEEKDEKGGLLLALYPFS